MNIPDYTLPKTRATAAAIEIRKRILEGHYPGGMALRQDALAEELGISRIPVREALVQLEAEGLVKIHAHRGAVVTGLQVEAIEELFELRSLVEPRLLEKSVPHLDTTDFKELRKILREYSDEMRLSHVGRWGELNTELHSCLYRHADSPRMEALAAQLLQNTDRFTRMQLMYTDGRERAEKEHEAIVDLCQSKKVKAASAVLRDHILDAGRALADVVRESHRAASDTPPPQFLLATSAPSASSVLKMSPGRRRLAKPLI
jgi:DNA-binding GntR family transcriptional regulator